MAAGNNQTIGHLSFSYKDYVLALPGWYPTWLDPLAGDFNQRHIKATSLYMPQVVLYVGKDQSGTLSKTEIRTSQPSDKLIEICVVYPQKKLKAWDVVYSNITFCFLLIKYSNFIKKKFGKPKLLHSYIVMRGGLAGLILGKRWKLPFILTENWTIYYPADPGYLLKRNKVFRNLVGRVFKNVKCFLPVTNDLKEKAHNLLGEVPSIVISNVVEIPLFNERETLSVTRKFRFIHISTMMFQKNPEGLLRVFKKFNCLYPNTFLQLVGPFPEHLPSYAKSIGLTENEIEFKGPVSYLEVAALLKSANSLVLFSRYENLPCVILEAFCCGLPVISTRVGGIAEVVNETNGILIDSENEDQLLEAFKHIYLNYKQYNSKIIADAAKQSFSYEAVGKVINEVYTKLVSV